MFKVLDEVCKPTKGSKYSAAVDLYAREDIVIGAGETVKVPLGVCIDLDKLSKKMFDVSYSYILKAHNKMLQEDFSNFMMKHYLQLEPRSSLRAKGLIAGTGIIDLDYKDEIMIILHNPVKAPKYRADALGTAYDMTYYKPFKISKGEKIAQIMLCEHKTYLMGIESNEERTGGFGSTGN